jgi:hypothetical protein
MVGCSAVGIFLSGVAGFAAATFFIAFILKSLGTTKTEKSPFGVEAKSVGFRIIVWNYYSLSWERPTAAALEAGMPDGAALFAASFSLLIV